MSWEASVLLCRGGVGGGREMAERQKKRSGSENLPVEGRPNKKKKKKEKSESRGAEHVRHGVVLRLREVCLNGKHGDESLTGSAHSGGP